jgi:signal transduction histidine kinase
MANGGERPLLGKENTMQDELESRPEEMEWFKSELMASVSHELRSPLASIKGYTATLLLHDRRIGREERLEFLHAIASASDRLEAVIDRLLEMSLLETGKLTLHLAPVNLVHLLREAFIARETSADDEASSARRSDRRSIVFQMQSLEQAEEAFVTFADRQRLREVFDHLLSNAVNYSPNGGTITVGISRSVSTSGRTTLPEDHLIEIWVRDEGMGISSAHQRRIFERFYRIDTSLTREVNGLGLGLAFCKRILQLHGGQIWMESETGQGSTFHVLLPASASRKEAEEQGEQ